MTNRNQFTTVCGINSKKADIKYGVPQGSLLGPLLFLLVLNDFGNLNINSEKFIYADDTCLLYNGCSEVEIHNKIMNDIDEILEYFKENGLLLNIKKTKIMYLGSKRKFMDRALPLYINNHEIERVNTFKYLGLIIDDEMKWDLHIKNLVAELRKIVGIMFKISKFTPVEIKLNMYYAFIHSKIQYAIMVWGNTNKKLLKTVQVLQNRALKCVYNLPFLYPTDELYFKNEILPVQGIYQYKTIIFVKEVLIGLRKTNISFSHPEHVYFTRNLNNILYPRIKASRTFCGLSTKGPIYYNKVPITIRSIESISFFGKSVKNWLFEPSNLSFFLDL